MNSGSRLPVAIGAGLLVALLGGFQAVVQASVERGATRRAALALAQEQAWRCKARRAPDSRLDCAPPLDIVAARGN